MCTAKSGVASFEAHLDHLRLAGTVLFVCRPLTCGSSATIELSWSWTFGGEPTLTIRPHKNTDSVELVSRIQEGDDQAAQELFDRFLQRLIGLARKRLPKAVGRRMDPDDIVQSALRSFFVHARQGDYGLQSSGELWRLLAAITVNKVRYHVRKSTAQKRSVNSETSVSTGSMLGVDPAALADSPSVEQRVTFEDQLREVMSGRTPRQRRIILLLLKGQFDKEIASEMGCTLRTVQRTKATFRQQLEKKLAESTPSNPEKKKK